jgi:hypothetical protein
VGNLIFHGRSPFDLFRSIDANGKSIPAAKLGEGYEQIPFIEMKEVRDASGAETPNPAQKPIRSDRSAYPAG